MPPNTILFRMLKIIECPRDAMQGIKAFIPTEKKIAYINQLLQVGFDTLDFGSFVSAKAIPQMSDILEVIPHINKQQNKTKLLAIVANQRGAEEAVQHSIIDYLGYPFSISETFQLRNTNATIAESVSRLTEIETICRQNKKELVVYISMGFGNPYGDEWSVEIVQKWANILRDIGIKILSLSDTIGVSNPDNIAFLFDNLIPRYPEIEFGAHLHTQPHNWYEKVDAAYRNGCRRIDAAIKGFGGCPMAKDDLTGNMATENVIAYLDEHDVATGLNRVEFARAMRMASDVFPTH